MSNSPVKSSLGLVNFDTETLMNDPSVNNGILKTIKLSSIIERKSFEITCSMRKIFKICILRRLTCHGGNKHVTKKCRPRQSKIKPSHNQSFPTRLLFSPMINTVHPFNSSLTK